MTIHAETHRVFDGASRNSHLTDVAMARGALDFCANMRGVIEADMRFFRPAEDAFPRNVVAVLVVTAQFHDLRMIGDDLFMAGPTGPNIGNGRLGAPIHGDVAIDAIQFGDFQMDAVNKGDRLLRLGAVSDEVLGGFRKGLMRRRKNTAFIATGLTRLRGKVSRNQPPDARCGKNRYKRNLPVVQAITSP